MSTGKFIPVVAIYSTFLEKLYDQILYDVCIEKLHVIFAIYSGGIVCKEGATHQGIFDLLYLRSIINMIIMAPKDENELNNMFYTAIFYYGTISFHFSKGKIVEIPIDTKMWKIEIGGNYFMYVGGGVIVIDHAVRGHACCKMFKKIYNVSVTVFNARFINRSIKKCYKVVQ